MRQRFLTGARHLARALTVLWLGTVVAFSSLPAQVWALGRYGNLGGAAGPLMARATPGMLTSGKFLAEVGGVAFVNVARPDSTYGPVHLWYDAHAADGRRLAVTVGGRTYRPPVPDWELVPTARYAAARENAVVTLFGPGTDADHFEVLIHPALSSTLLGLRLLQADMLLEDPESLWQLPTRDGSVVLGLGEASPTGPDERAVRVANLIKGLDDGPDSWLLTDKHVPIEFGVHDGAFRITGYPYYHFIQMNPTEQSDSLGWLAYEDSAAGDTLARRKHEVASRAAMEVVELGELTDALRSDPSTVRMLNPQVFDAATTLMRYAAFFRYVQKNDPAGYDAFLRSIAAVSPEPPATVAAFVPRR